MQPAGTLARRRVVRLVLVIIIKNVNQPWKVAIQFIAKLRCLLNASRMLVERGLKETLNLYLFRNGKSDGAK